MKTITFTAEEIYMLEIQLQANPCAKGCPLHPHPRLPKLESGAYDCYARRPDGEYICRYQRMIEKIEKKLGL